MVNCAADCTGGAPTAIVPPPPLFCYQVHTPWPITLADAQDVYEAAQPSALFTKRMKVQGVRGNVRKFVACTPRAPTAGATNDKTAQRLENAKRRREEYVPSVEYCEECNVRVIYNSKEACCACPRCGISKNYQAPDTSYREGVHIHVPYLYQRANHFRDHLKRVSGRESTQISQWILDAVTAEVHKRTDDFASISPEDMRAILKMLRKRHKSDSEADPMLKQSSLYNHTVRIWALVTKQQPPVISQVQQAELLHLFTIVQEPWLKRKPEGRINFLSYAYILNKMCNMLGYTELAQHFKLLKSRDKIIAQDQMWASICKDVGLEFVRSSI